ncbi:MAG: hypothetical protein HY236_10475 [Acidobacteria bacterium]|nr:hypothetical protein [Acidobacteriota bacterium]
MSDGSKSSAARLPWNHGLIFGRGSQEVAKMKCPRCGLLNPDSAQRCDCGYDFESKTVKGAYFKQKLPREFRTYLVLLLVSNVLVGLAALWEVLGGRGFASRDVRKLGATVVWSGLVWWLYAQLVRKKNWARLALVLLTFPAGLLLGLSREARLYCLQK